MQEVDQELADEHVVDVELLARSVVVGVCIVYGEKHFNERHT